MSKSNGWETGLLNVTFCNIDYANLGDAGGLRGSATAGNLYVSLHTADPADTGNQTTSEIGYTGYARVAVARGTAGWTVSNNQVTNAGAITFPACGATGGTATYFGVGVAGTALSAGTLLYSGALTAQLIINSGITPSFAAGQLTITED